MPWMKLATVSRLQYEQVKIEHLHMQKWAHGTALGGISQAELAHLSVSQLAVNRARVSTPSRGHGAMLIYRHAQHLGPYEPDRQTHKYLALNVLHVIIFQDTAIFQQEGRVMARHALPDANVWS